MISVDELDKTILELEQRDTTYATCEKLAWLYIVKDHLQPIQKTSQVNIEKSGDSEFLLICEGLPAEKVLNVINEHMECIKALYPREYNAIIEKLKNI